MRWDSPIVLVSAGSIAIHLIVFTIIDAIVVTHPYRPLPPAPTVEMFDVDVDVPAPPPPPPEVPPVPDPVRPPPTVPPPPTARPRVQTRVATSATPTPARPDPTPPPPNANPTAGGQDYQMPDLQPGRGPAFQEGKNRPETPGRGSGSGTGAGSGSGTGTEGPPAQPMSVAMIKTRALPKGDYGYVDAARDYPTEARQQGIEGQIRVKLVVGPDGGVKKATLLNRLGHGLDEWALARAKTIEFTPAVDTDDKPVTSVVIWTFDMTLPK